jgi:excisionase family DNA binding protein
LTVEETAIRLALSKDEVYNMISTEDLACVRRGRRLMVDICDVDAWAYRDRRGKIIRFRMWTLRYYIDGKLRQEPASTEDYKKALALLRKRMADPHTPPGRLENPQQVRMNQCV